MHLEHYEPQSTWRSSMLLFVAGTAIGAAAALMMAPASGRESREYLRKQGRRMADDFGAQADRVASAMRRGRDQATHAVRETMDSAIGQAKAAYSAARNQRAPDEEPVGSPLGTRSPRPSMTSSS
jgi:gas vesicle protein